MYEIQQHHLESRSLAYTWSHGPVRQPLVVLHGLGDSSIHTYAPRFSSTVLRDTPVLFIDLPGFGEGKADESYPATLEAMADDVASLLDFLDVCEAPIFAHSMGANIALLLAAAQPRFTSSIILAEPLLDPEQSVLAAGIAKQDEHSFLTRGYRMLVRATSLQMHRGDVAAAVFLRPLQMADPRVMHRSASSLVQARKPSFIDVLHTLQIQPTLLVGEHSLADNTNADALGVRVVQINDAGHYMMADQSESLANDILGLMI